MLAKAKEQAMDEVLEHFAAECHRILKADPGPAGRERVAGMLRDVLSDAGFLAANLGPGTPERKVLYEDRELGFCILAHRYEGARESAPHDHGPSWAIYGQASGETEMTEWEVVEAASAEKAGKVRRLKTYALKPGMSQLYNEGQLHSPRREGPSALIRIEGMNMEHVSRLAYEPVG
jgi:hypothetical protein